MADILKTRFMLIPKLIPKPASIIEVSETAHDQFFRQVPTALALTFEVAMRTIAG
jgi:hypothetical protein